MWNNKNNKIKQLEEKVKSLESKLETNSKTIASLNLRMAKQYEEIFADFKTGDFFYYVDGDRRICPCAIADYKKDSKGVLCEIKILPLGNPIDFYQIIASRRTESDNPPMIFCEPDFIVLKDVSRLYRSLYDLFTTFVIRYHESHITKNLVEDEISAIQKVWREKINEEINTNFYQNFEELQNEFRIKVQRLLLDEKPISVTESNGSIN